MNLMNPRRIAVMAVICLAATGCGGSSTSSSAGSGSGDQSSIVEAAAGADICEDSGYFIESRLDGSKTTIYSCRFGAKNECVTYANGIATDSTEEVKLLFANVLGQSSPACLEGTG